MKRKIIQFAAFILILALALPGDACAAPGGKQEMVRVGLFFGSTAMVGSNLQNNTGYGAGYRFGYYDGDLDFVEAARTGEKTTEVTVLKAQNVWYYYDRSTGAYVYETSDNGGTAIGCYHIRLPGAYDDFDGASAAAEEAGGFVAWIDGEYQVRYGAYVSKEKAQEALDSLGEGSIVGTSSYAVTVIATGTSTVLYQHDGGAERPLGILPDVTGAETVRTWCKGYKYGGGFRYERIDGGDLTVVNVLDLESYIKGVIPYEMNNAWPLEALKTQAVCARSYAKVNIGESKHRAYHIDVCATACCQAYHGVGTNRKSYQANGVTDRAVEETTGMYALYNGQPIPAYYSSSHGGASESIYNVWGSALSKTPYLCGVIDPYESGADSINANSSWTVKYTAAELTSRLQSKGFGTGTSVDHLELEYSDLGNVIRVVVHWKNGNKNTIKASGGTNGIRNVFNLKSIHFTVNGASPSDGGDPGGLTINGSEALSSLDGVYVISGSGAVSALDGTPYTISGSGTVAEASVGGGGESGEMGGTVSVSGSSYTITGSGWGHQLGMSQYGAYAMAQKGFTYDEIVEFYYPGVSVGQISQ